MGGFPDAGLLVALQRLQFGQRLGVGAAQLLDCRHRLLVVFALLLQDRSLVTGEREEEEGGERKRKEEEESDIRRGGGG